MNPLLIFFAIAGASATAVGGFVAYDRYQNNQKTEIAKLAEPTVQAPKAPQVDAAKKVVKEKLATPQVPTFDIVRVEKDGNMLVAGQAAPNSDITLMNGDQPIGTGKADDAGAFVILPDNPLQGADNQISIRSKLKNGTTIPSEQQVAIAVPDDGEALVALVEPGKPVEIIQKPEPVAVAPEPAVVASESAAVAKVPDLEPEVVPKVAEETKPVTEPVTVVEKTKPEPVETVVAKIEEVAEEVKPDPVTIVEAVQKPIEEAREESKKRVARLLLDAQPEQPAPSVEDVVVEAPKSAEELSPEAPAVTAPAVEEEPVVEQVAAVAEEKKPEPAPVVEPQKTVSVEAVEVENDTLFVAGTASPNETVRVYVDDKLVGDVKTGEGGQWLLEETKPLGPGEYNIRVDLLEKGSGDVIARAAVPFAVQDLTPAELAKAEVGNVIIRKNDNLWTIAQRLYGDGRRYTSIYQQNRDQIKNPELIFPGQIFKVPTEGQVPGAASTVDQAVVVAPLAKPEDQ